MVIYDVDCFGLFQFYQFCGWVGWGDYQFFCILMVDLKFEIGKEWMRIMLEINDGFELFEKDFELCGFGDFFGKKQSGMFEFKVVDMVYDYRVLEMVCQDVVNLVLLEVFWKDDEYCMFCV